MKTSQLIYTGPLAECGFRGPVTGVRYVARRGQAFTVDQADGAALLRRYPAVLHVVPVTNWRKSADESGGEDEGGRPDGPRGDGDAPAP